MKTKHHSSILAAGLALFSMFFGAGDLIWPLILGGDSGDMNFWTIIGFLITAVSLPLLGLCAMLACMGDIRAFFSKVGRIPCLILVFIIQAIVGPVGSIPRLYTLSHATLAPYFSFDIGLFGFSLLASMVVFLLSIKKRQIIEILGKVLTPILLLSITGIVIAGLIDHPLAPVSPFGAGEAFYFGLSKGYNTLDLIASFIFAPFVLSYFCDDGAETAEAKQIVVKKMLYASLLAAGLLTAMFLSMSYLASYYVPLLPEGTPNEARFSALSLLLLGPSGELFSSLAVVMACLTTAIPLTSIGADYIREDLFRNKVGRVIPLLIVLAVSTGLANLGFMGIAHLLEPLLQMLCPLLIILSLVNMSTEVSTSKVT